MEDLLESFEERATRRNFHGQALADDTLAVVAERSAELIELAWPPVWEDLKVWAVKNKLNFNSAKTSYLFHPARSGVRPPLLTVDNLELHPVGEMRYLGFVVDPKFFWLNHLNYLRGKATGLAHRLRYVAGSTWGITPRILRVIYLRAILPMFLYGASVWGCRALLSRMRVKIDALARGILLGITRSYRTVSTQALYVLAGIPPLSISAFEAYQSSCRRKTEVYEKLMPVASLDHPAERHRIDFHHYNPCDLSTYTFYTDGSKREGRVGCAFVMYVGNDQAYQQGERLGNANSVFQAEVYAIVLALSHCLNHKLFHHNISICSDSRSALGAITSPVRLNPAVFVARGLLKDLMKKTNVRLFWVKAHAGITGNEAADLAAKDATNYDHQIALALPISTSSLIMAQDIMQKWQRRWDVETVGRPVYTFIPSVSLEFVQRPRKLIQFLTNHGNFAAYLRRFGLGGNGACRCGNGDEDRDHIFRHCELVERAGARDRFLLRVIPQGFAWDRLQDVLDCFCKELSDFVSHSVFDEYCSI